MNGLEARFNQADDGGGCLRWFDRKLLSMKISWQFLEASMSVREELYIRVSLTGVSSSLIAGIEAVPGGVVVRLARVTMRRATGRDIVVEDKRNWRLT